MPADQQDLERTKQIVEFAKHITTVSTASILVLTTILTKVVTDVRAGGLLPWVLGSFGIAIIAAVIGQGYAVERLTNPARRPSRYLARAFLVAQVAFVAGILLLVVFSIINYRR
jgi:hypothetical protein